MKKQNALKNFVQFALTIGVSAAVFYFVRKCNLEDVQALTKSMDYYIAFWGTALLTIIYKLYSDTATVKALSREQRIELRALVNEKVVLLGMLLFVWLSAYGLKLDLKILPAINPSDLLAGSFALLAFGTFTIPYIWKVWSDLTNFLSNAIVECEAQERRLKELDVLNKQ